MVTNIKVVLVKVLIPFERKDYDMINIIILTKGSLYNPSHF